MRIIFGDYPANTRNGYRDTGCLERTGCLRRGGFTLVEMLVSVALVVLMMGIFASAFQIATSVMLRQRGVAENDQRARSIVTMLQGDLQKRTYRQRSDAVTHTLFTNAPPASEDGLETSLSNTANRNALGIVPLHPDYSIEGVGGTGRAVDAERERGYFYISENNPVNDADDVLQFTVDANNTELGSSDTTPYTGRARPLGVDLNDDGGADLIPTWNGAAVNADQPIWDDGIGFKILSDDTVESFTGEDTGTSDSPSAEVSIFLRNGNLMRRVLLIRDPLVGNFGGDDQPSLPDESDFVPQDYDVTVDLSPTPGGGSDFWNDFDSSATRVDPEVISAPGRMRFNVAEDLDNSTVVTPTPEVTKTSALGNPQNRFGHDPSPRRDALGLQGRPKEFLFPMLPNSFIGRYTHEETSSPGFGFPGVPSGGAELNVLTPFSPDIPLAADPFPDGPRQGEDILMTNVHAFDIKVWDAALGDWADIGHSRSVQKDFYEDGSAAQDIPELGDWHFSRVFGVLPGNEWSPFANQLQPFTIGDINNPTDAPSRVLPYQSARRQMYWYGSLDGSLVPAVPTALNRIFDTWHPQFNFNTSNDAGVDPSEVALDDPPPFRPLWSDRSNFDIESAGGVRGISLEIRDRTTRATFNERMRPVVWEPGAAYEFPIPRSGDNPADPDVAPCRVFPIPRERGGVGASGEFYPGHQSMFYQVVDVNDLNGDEVYRSANLPPGEQPPWRDAAVAGEEITDGEIIWRAVNNTFGLQAIQITLRFLDPTSRQMRQVTIVHSLVEQ